MIAAKVRMLVVISILLLSMLGCSRGSGGWHLEVPSPVVGAVQGGTGLFVLTSDGTTHRLLKVDPEGQIAWQTSVTEQELVGASRTGNLLLLADRTTGRGVLRSGDTGNELSAIPGDVVELSADGRRVLAVPELSTFVHLFDAFGHKVWSQSGVSDANGDLASATGHVLHWTIRTVDLLSPNGVRMWRWQAPSGEWVTKANVSPDGQLAVLETGDAPPYPHGDGGRLRQRLILDRSGQVVARPSDAPVVLLRDGQWVRVNAGQLQLTTVKKEGSMNMELPSDCGKVSLEAEEPWLVARCSEDEAAHVFVWNVSGRLIFHQEWKGSGVRPVVVMAPEQGMIWVAQDSFVDGYRVTPERIVEPEGPKEQEIAPLGQADRALAGLQLLARQQDVLQLLGEPALKTVAGDGTGEAWQYRRGLTVVLNPKDDTVSSLLVQHPSVGCTTRLICLGDSVERVEGVYGQPYGGEIVGAFDGASVYANQEAAAATIFGFDASGRVDLIEVRDLSRFPRLLQLPN